jgi:predicted RNase H-like HicB family nuclease
MLSDYMDKAMQHAQYERIEDGTYFATIPGFEGLWANGSTEQECKKQLREVLEGWILLGIAHHDTLPEVEGMRLEVGKAV